MMTKPLAPESAIKKKVAIHGFGRTLRLVLRQLVAHRELEVIAINDIAPYDNLRYLLQNNSLQSCVDFPVELDQGRIKWLGQEIPFSTEHDPAVLPWNGLAIDIVIEACGSLTKREQAAKHLEAGVQSVIISAPNRDADITICMGVNEGDYDSTHHQVVSNASCTTHCLACVAKVLDDAFGIENGFLSTIHTYNPPEVLVGRADRKWNPESMIVQAAVPTTAGVALAATQILPHLQDKLDGLTVHMPDVPSSMLDFVVQTKKPIDLESVNSAFRAAANSERMKGILGVTHEDLAPADIWGSNYSALIDTQSTLVLGTHSVKVIAWYDNDWGHTRRIGDLTAYVARSQHMNRSLQLPQYVSRESPTLVNRNLPD